MDHFVAKDLRVSAGLREPDRMAGGTDAVEREVAEHSLSWLFITCRIALLACPVPPAVRELEPWLASCPAKRSYSWPVPAPVSRPGSLSGRGCRIPAGRAARSACRGGPPVAGEMNQSRGRRCRRAHLHRQVRLGQFHQHRRVAVDVERNRFGGGLALVVLSTALFDRPGPELSTFAVPRLLGRDRPGKKPGLADVGENDVGHPG